MALPAYDATPFSEPRCYSYIRADRWLPYSPAMTLYNAVQFLRVALWELVADDGVYIVCICRTELNAQPWWPILALEDWSTHQAVFS